ncbi:MAG: cold shock domain-containing protein [Myxococcales bacterium]|nr:cold shock domain-containing protein [Myxococcales bacterium]MDH5306840.1 cold shock domain-containing protein [Myxococcales bacterium]MDH5567843.1 cold shock domain-containing protein [Myxococcales bacterium]
MEIHWKEAGDIRDAVREEVDQRLQELAGEHRDLIDIRIAAKPNQHHRHGGQEVHIVCQARGREIVAARTRPDLELALHDAIRAFERAVRKLRERRTTLRVQQPAQPPHFGVVDRIFAEDDYGFILTDEGDQVYFHRNAVTGNLVFDALREGARVGLNFEAGLEGLQATSVVAPPPGARVA